MTSRPHFIASRLVGTEAARQVTGIRTQTHLFGSTTGPFEGIGGSAMTAFVMTELAFGDVLVYFAGEKFLGSAKAGSVAQQRFPAVSEYATADLTCDRAAVAHLIPSTDTLYEKNVKAITAKLQLGIDVEADDPNLADVVSGITPRQVEWIAAWLSGEGVRA